MVIRTDHYVLDIDPEATQTYSRTHSLCDCNEDRNFYAQARERFPKLASFLAELGLIIERPDEIGSSALESAIDYHFVSYTVAGTILESGEYEVDLFDGGLFLNIVINNWYVPNEQNAKNYFTVTVYGIRLPWVLDEPFPAAPIRKPSLLSRIRTLFRKN